MGAVGGTSGKNCRKDRYSGYFAEFGHGAAGGTAGFDIGFDNANIPGYSGIPLPGSPSGVGEAGVGLGTPGPKVALCYYIPF